MLGAHLFELLYRDARDRVLQQLEHEYLRVLLARHGRNVSAVAEAAGINRTHLHRMIRRHGL